MRKVLEHSHLGGSEILSIRYPEIEAALNQAIADAEPPDAIKPSSGKAKQGIRAALKANGFRAEDEPRGRSGSLLLTGAARRVGLVRRRVVVEALFERVPEAFYSLAGFQDRYATGQVDVAVAILPSNRLRSRMSGHITSGEEMLAEAEGALGLPFLLPLKIVLVE